MLLDVIELHVELQTCAVYKCRANIQLTDFYVLGAGDNIHQ